MKRLLPLLILLLAAAKAGAQGGPAPYGLQYMAHFDRLAEYKDTVCKQISSYDRTGGNGDWGHFLNGDTGKLPNDRALLADIKGPGCIYRLWSANAEGYIRFYFDGEKDARIACPMQDIFQDKYPPFHKPLAGQSSGGWYCYFPIPFEKSVRIEVDHPKGMYYHVEYQLLPQNTPVRTFTREITPDDQVALDMVLRHWKNAGQLPDGGLDRLDAHNGEKSIGPGEKATLLSESSGGTVRSMRVKVKPATRYTLRDLVIRAYWDGAKKPAVEAPAGDFFGTGFGEQRFKAQPVAMSEDGFSCYYPMPYAKGARIEIENQGTESVDLSWKVQTGASPQDPRSVGRFHAKWNRVTTEKGKHVTLLQTEGRGHYVGVNLNMQGDRGLGFLEGDEKIYVDGETFPSIYGTGTEDFFTGGWYFDKGPFSLPYHGCIVKDDPHSRISAYRYQITDCVPFKKNIRVDIEHGGENDYPGADYCFTAYWYQDSATDGYGPLPNVEARHPASYMEPRAVEAESLQLTNGKVMNDRDLPIELSRGQAAVGATPRGTWDIQLDASETAPYSATVGLLKSPAGGKAWFTLDGQALGGIIDLYDANTRIERLDLGSLGTLTKGPHKLTIHPLAHNSASTGDVFAVDYLLLRRPLYPGALEGEQLRIIQQTPNEPLGPQPLNAFGDRWSGDAHLWFRPSKPGASFTLEVPVTKTGQYRVSVYMTKAVDYGQVEFSLDGEKIGKTFDGYNNGVVPSGRIDLGELNLSEGNHALKFTVTGKNAKSVGYMAGVDAILLKPVGE